MSGHVELPVDDEVAARIRTRSEDRDPRVPSGWRDLVDRLDRDLCELFPDYRVVLAREKHGRLDYWARVPDADSAVVLLSGSAPPTSASAQGYEGRGLAAASALLASARARSVRTCARCGSDGTMRLNRRWVLPLCDACDADPATPG